MVIFMINWYTEIFGKSPSQQSLQSALKNTPTLIKQKYETIL